MTCTHPMTIEDAEALVIVLCDQAGDGVPVDVRESVGHIASGLMLVANGDGYCAALHFEAAAVSR